MRKRSSKILAASLSLLIGLNGMPLTALAVENEPTTPSVSDSVQENETAESTPEEKEPASKTEEQQPSDEENVSEVAGENKEESLTGESEGTTEEKTEEELPAEEEPAAEKDPAEETTAQEQPAAEEEPSAEAPAGPAEDPAEESAEKETENATPEEETAEQPVQQKVAAYAPAGNTVLLDAQDANADVLHVSADGNGGAYTSLKAAVDAANGSAAQQVTIELDSDITVTECARIDGKDIILDGNGHTISRGDDFQTIQDNNRSTYNPAMIEVTVGSSRNASLTLESVVLDDKNLYEGTVFSQAVSVSDFPEGNDSNGGYNTRFVQDAIVAVYGTNTYTATLTMKNGTVLKNFGGMSAVRLIEGANLIMESGSVILDDMQITRNKGKEEDSLGPAGAVWVQGANNTTNVFTMNSGAVIKDMNGRAVYVDNGKATIAGTIQNITGSTQMWQGKAGTAIHIRNNADVTMTGDARIENVTGTDAAVKLVTQKAKFTMDQGTQISGVSGTAISAQGTGMPGKEGKLGKDEITLTVDGIVTGVTGGNVINLNDSDGIYCKVGESARFENNTLNNGAIYMQGHGVTVDFYGQISNNVCTNGPGAVWVANNYDGGSMFNMYEPAEIKNNISSVNECGTINVSMGTFEMFGGTISDNYVIGTEGNTSATAAPVWVRRNGVFIMHDGSITGNGTNNKTSGAVLFDSDIHSANTTTKPVVELLGGTIAGNKMSATISQDQDSGKYTLTGGEEQNVAISTLLDKGKEKSFANIERYMQISEDMDIGNTRIYLEKYDLFLGRPAGSVKFGNAADDAVSALEAAATEQGWSDPLASLWVYSDSHEAALRLSQPAGLKDELPVYLAAMPVNASGTPDPDAEVTFYGVKKQDGELLATVPGENEYGYVVAFVQPGMDFGAMTISVPESLDAKQIGEGETAYTIPGTAVYTMSSNLITLMKAEKPTDMTLSVEVDPALTIDASAVTLTSDLLQASKVVYEDGVLTVTCTLKTGWESSADMTATLQWTGRLPVNDFQAGSILETAGAFRATIPDETKPIEAYVPAQPAVTQLIDGVLIRAADITVYMGGEAGYEGVVSNGTIVGSKSLPEPGFEVKLPAHIKASDLEFKEASTGKTWTLEPYDGDTSHSIYKIVPAEGQDPLRVQFTNAAGETVTSDNFTVGDAVNQTFTMSIYQGSVGTVVAMPKVDATSAALPVISESGTLTVRGTTDNVQYSKLNETLQAGKPGVKADADVIFTINDSNLNANQDAIALLFDNIIENTASESGRSSLLAKRADEILKDVAVPAGMVRNYEFRYLDLVDTSNGNAWVEAKDANGNPAEVTVCWPYPAGTNKDTDFTLLHFEDLHRDMNANEVAGDIASCTVTPMTITKTDTHIEFTTTEFSPFALAWNSPLPVPAPEEEEKPVGDGEETVTTPTVTPAPTAQPAAPTAQPAASTAQPAAVIPQTGDNSQPLLWAALLVVSGSLGVALALKRRKE